MLDLLRIKNIAIIDQAEIPFKKGLNIISGETGAGKSIVIEAIGLLLGGRAQTDLIRSGCEEAVVEGLFSTQDISWIDGRLEDLGFPKSDGELLIKRVLSLSGRHRIYVNGELANLQTLQKLTQGLIDLCGQHENQSLLKSSKQMELLDRFGGTIKTAEAIGEQITELKASLKTLEELRNAEIERSRKTEFLKFQIEELESAELRAGEDEELQAEKKLFSTVEQRQSTVQSIVDALSGGDADTRGVLDSIRTLVNRSRGLLQQDQGVGPWVESMERGLFELEEASMSFSRYLDSISFDPERMSYVQERLARLAELRRKHAADISELITRLESMKQELGVFENVEASIKEQEKKIEALSVTLKEQGDKLAQKRKKSAKQLAEAVTQELKELRMEQAKFQPVLETIVDVKEWSESLGPNSIQFFIQTNAGDEARPLGQIASGGELSRILLSIRRVISDQGGIGVYLFDEIDAGIGGQTAFVVGRKLKSVAKNNQVICITHVPQVAAFADHHLSVIKTTEGKRTLTDVKQLATKDRTEELARMLGGDKVTKTSLENAKELLSRATV